jgi:hypothetical protein
MTDEFTFSDLLPIIEKQNPKIGARLRENRASLSAVLKTMSKTGELEVARNGFGSLPNIYRVKALRVEEEE